jgi:cytidine deaminase
MSTVTITKEKESAGKNEILAMLALDDGKELRFHLKKHSIRVDPPIIDKKSWYDYTPEQDRLKVISAILSEYRKRSLGDYGYLGAAIGVTEDNKIFIGINTKNQEEYFKDCAEQNMLNAATDQVVHQAVREGKKKPDKPPKMRAVYMMGGREEGTRGPKDEGLLISCPCGKCTDMLSKVMAENAEIFAIPITYNENTADIRIRNGDNSDMTQVLKGEVWKTTIGRLNADRDIDLELTRKGEKTISIQRDGLKKALKYAASKIGYKDTDVFDGMRVNQPGLPAPLAIILGATVQPMTDLIEASDQKIKELQRFGEVALKAAENAITGRKSIPELDLAAKGNECDLEPINRFMVEHIKDTVASRLRSSGLSPKDKGWEEAFEQQITAVRCCVVRLDNGTFHYAIEAQTEQDNAAPNAEVSAITSAMEKLTEYRIRNVWVMEMRPKDIEKGHMHTSPKEGIERLVKRGTKVGELTFNYIPFNDGNLEERRLKDYVKPYKMNEIFPAAFKGNRLVVGGDSQASAKG